MTLAGAARQPTPFDDRRTRPPMFTYLGKFLVLLNAFAAVAVLAWAASAYFTRVDAAEAVDVSGEKLTDQVKRLDRAAVAAQAGYAPELDRVAVADARLFDLKAKIAARLQQAETGTFYNIYLDPGPNQRDPSDPNALDRVGRLTWESPMNRQIKGLDGQALRGVEQMTKELADEQKAASDHIAAIQKSVQELTTLNTHIAALDARYKWLEEVGKRHEAEIPVLADLRVNWENRGGSLLRRRNQLIRRLEDLTGSKVGAAAPPPVAPAPAPAASLTAGPRK